MRHVLDSIGSIMVATYGWYIRKRMDPILAMLFILEICCAILPKSCKPLEPRDVKGSFKGDIGPYEACIGLYWQYYGSEVWVVYTQKNGPYTGHTLYFGNMLGHSSPNHVSH